MGGLQKAATLAQVGQFYFAGVGQFYIAANKGFDIFISRTPESKLTRSYFGKTILKLQLEPPRVLRRLQSLREWSHEETTQIFP